jgi:alkaline phosphatase D
MAASDLSPTQKLDRRTVLRGGLAGAGSLGFPAASLAAGSGFTHGVASGEPGADRVLLWTRFVGAVAPLRYEISEAADFAKVVAGGEVGALPDRDWCAKVVAEGLQPGRWYHYRFVGPAGELSPVGRTRTLPVGRTERFRMAVFSCSNLGFGWFNAYAHAVEDGAFDAVVHLGDYYYEYKKGEYPKADEALAERVLLPEHEILTLADYRARQADYRADPDLQRLFQSAPWIMVWDDHETANDSWKGGAENHQPRTEGPWPLREAAAMRAYHEWLPVSEERWKSYEIGDLATLFRLETRLTARDKQFEYAELLDGVQPERVATTLDAFRDGAWRDPARTLMGSAQEAWLAKGLATSRRARRTWQVLAQQIVMGELMLPPEIADGLPADMPAASRQRIANRVAATREGLPFNLDAWDGYPAARARLLASARAADANLVVLSGDSHNAWANDLVSGRDPAGIEFAGTSVTSPGFERSLAWVAPDRLAEAAVRASPGLKWCDMSQRGYLAVELTPARATAEYRFMDTVRRRSTRLSGTHRLSGEAGRNRLA